MPGWVSVCLPAQAEMQSSIAKMARGTFFPATGPSGDIVKASCDEQKFYYASGACSIAKNLMGGSCCSWSLLKHSSPAENCMERIRANAYVAKFLLQWAFKKPTKTSHTSGHDDQPNLAS